MQNRQSGGRRRRGGGGNNGNNPRPMGMASGGQSANRLEVKVRGNAHQLLEKYKQLARDAHQAGDRVAAEYYLQHSDHYFRVLNDGRIRQEEMRARRGVFDQFEDDAGEGEDAALDGGEEQPREQGRDGSREGGRDGERRPRYEQRERSDRERPERDRSERNEGDREGGEQGERPRRWQERRERPRDVQAEAPRLSGETIELHMSDGEAALVAFGGVPAREAPAEEAVEEAPKPRRRGRPRKTEAEPVES